jgi:hypothetical protein
MISISIMLIKKRSKIGIQLSQEIVVNAMVKVTLIGL